MTQTLIAAKLEEAFCQFGFAKPSVSELKDFVGVSLRTLYRHYPSKELMVTGALEYRHSRYLHFLNEGKTAATGPEAVLHLFKRQTLWMKEFASNGCLFMNALTAFPQDESLCGLVKKHKQDIVRVIQQMGYPQDQAQELFLVHEALSSTWPLLQEQAAATAQNMALKIIGE